MWIQRFEPDGFSEAYGILCQSVAPWQEGSAAPFASTWCTIPPGGISRAHKHSDHESFFIVRGRGRIDIDGEIAEIGPGDVVFMEPFSSHELTNLSAEEEIFFLDVCWIDQAEAARRNATTLEGAERPRRVLVTATPPTPNGDLHVGHLSGPYLAADVHARYLRLRGVEAYYLTGIDDHQSYVAKKAVETGSTPEKVARHYGDAMVATLEGMGIRPDHVARPADSPYHRPMTVEIFERLAASGALVAREKPTLYCEVCEHWLFEVHVAGGCPHCGAGTYGNACEVCGWPNDCAELRDPVCRHCQSPAAVRPLERFYFPLAPHEEALRRATAGAYMNPRLAALCGEMIEKGLPEIAVSQVSDWGIPVPAEGFEGQTLYAWFEMAPGYLAATRELLDRRGEEASWRRLWQEADEKVVQFFGFDNGYFHALLFPAVFAAYDPALRPPQAFVMNALYLYEGEKFSTSRNHALWGPELLEKVPADVARFYLAWDGPESEETSFSMSRLEETVRRELVEGWQGWLAELGARLDAESGGAVPGTGAWTAEQQRFHHRLGELTAQAAVAYEAESFSPQRLARLLSELVREARRFGRAEEPWARIAGGTERRRTGLALEALAAKTLALLAAPLMPGFARDLWRDLGFEGTPEAAGWEEVPEPIPGGQKASGLGRGYFEASAVPAGAAS